MTLQHPADRGGDKPGRFARLAEYTSNFTSSPAFFGICMILVGVVIGAHFAKLDVTWLLLAGESMTAVTLLLLALLKNSERRAEYAIQRKLDAIAAALLETQEGNQGEALRDLRKAIEIEDNS
ncbi:low affinity iron permease family protein [Streptomyces sp. NBC_01498]|uniref:low affinity iron permease family protein n=1 Tax=Streptomyces sp. NBC_01498 TaxID=2975870 RepID=UPI002E7C162A|nr:low affinity iron permease family protein [Streptomyces sp. NBC_01498]WTL24190.1 low affinity iron permease family protein [Streptomyces sp. NBC_01498]